MAKTRVTSRYVPATRRRDLPAGSPYQAMDAFLLSNQLQAPVVMAARDIAADAVAIARAEITSDSSTDAYVDSIDVDEQKVITINTFPRVAAAVTANGGRSSWGGFTDPESSHAAVVEFGNAAAPQSGRRIFGRAGAKYNTPKGVG